MRRSTPRHDRRSRRGVESVEFALVLPILVLLSFGGFDHGWFWFQQYLATGAVMTGMREGAMGAPTEAEGDLGAACEACVTSAGARASLELARWGLRVDAVDLQPEIIGVSGVCMMVLNAEIPATSIIGLVSTPNHYTVSAAVSAQAVKGCDT